MSAPARTIVWLDRWRIKLQVTRFSRLKLMPNDTADDSSSIVDIDQDELTRRPQGTTDLTVGTEVEAPMARGAEASYTEPGVYSGDLVGLLRDRFGGRRAYPDGYIGTDPTAGVEIRSDPLTPVSLSDWFARVIRDIRRSRGSGTSCVPASRSRRQHRCSEPSTAE